MSLPPGFLDQLRDRLSLGQVVGRKVMWDNRKSNPGKGDLWAPCPFHQEKTASFHVDDRKGFYYCFGCHAKGDAISFVRETENVGFMEAIQILAAEAGLPIPERDPQAQQKADERTQLIEVMEQAVQHFRLNLNMAVAGDARDYLVQRGLDADAQARWGIGFAPDRGGVLAHLTGKGVAQKLVMDAGLAAESDRGGSPYDRFRGRIMFPIHDSRGRPIAFGGRAMDPNHPAKYYNSPETALFDKSRTLYNVQKAREAAGKGQPLVVAEGYMDVIALSEAGFEATVAPLGTAVTEHHLRMLWRIAPEPIIALDGDTAGLRAAMRTIDIALPLLEAGQSLRFALMPDGMDPDDVLKSKGRGAMQKLLDGAIPMVELLWRRETDGKSFDSPERKAALDKALRDKIKLIADPSIRSHYGQAIKDMRWELFRPRKATAPKGKRQAAWGKNQSAWERDLSPTATSKSSALGTGAAAEDDMRISVILATLLATPSVVLQFEGDLERLDTQNNDHLALRDALLRHAEAPDVQAAIRGALGDGPVDALLGQKHLSVIPSIRRAGDAELATMCLTEEFAKLAARRSQPAEIREGEEEISGQTDENLTWRLARAARAVDTTIKPEGKTDDGDFQVADNGAKLSKDDRDHRDAIWANIKIEKSK